VSEDEEKEKENRRRRRRRRKKNRSGSIVRPKKMTLAVHWTPCYGMRNATLPKATLCCRCKGASLAVRVTKTVTCEGESGESSSSSSSSSSRQSETRKLGFGTKNSKSENRRGHKQGGEADGLNANGKKSAEKRAVAMREGSKQLQNVLRNVDKVRAYSCFFFSFVLRGFFFCRTSAFFVEIVVRVFFSLIILCRIMESSLFQIPNVLWHLLLLRLLSFSFSVSLSVWWNDESKNLYHGAGDGSRAV
jgi:hypothetical protein